MGPFTCLIEREKPSILVVDDIPSNLELMEAVFQKEGFKVYTALGASDAIDKFKNHPVDLAVLDVMMPGIDGFELCCRQFSNPRSLPMHHTSCSV